MSIEAMKLALAAVEAALDKNQNHEVKCIQSAIALRHAINQAENQEPVAWVYLEEWKSGKSWPDDCFTEDNASPEMTPLYTAPVAKKPGWSEVENVTEYLDDLRGGAEDRECVGEIVEAFGDLTAVSIPEMPPVGTKLYAAPKEWIGLTDDDLYQLWCSTPPEREDRYGLARAVEAKLKEKNA